MSYIVYIVFLFQSDKNDFLLFITYNFVFSKNLPEYCVQKNEHKKTMQLKHKCKQIYVHVKYYVI